jgi:hypothetical protein
VRQVHADVDEQGQHAGRVHRRRAAWKRRAASWRLPPPAGSPKQGG